MTGIDGLGGDFLRRVERACLFLAPIGLLALWAYAGPRAALGGLAGVALTLLNLRLLEFVFRRVLRPQPQWGPRVTLALLLKVPFVVTGALLALFVAKLPTLWFTVGFSFPLVVALLKVAGQLVNRRAGIGADAKAARRGLHAVSLVLGFLAISSVVLAVGSGLVVRSAGDGELERWVGAAPSLAAEEEPHVSGATATPRVADEHVGQSGGHEAEGGEHHDSHPEFPTWISVLYAMNPDAGWAQFMHKWETPIFSLLVITIIAIVAMAASRNPQMIPGPLQNAVELGVEGFHDFISGILGQDAKRYLPFLGTLFVYIWFSNLMGLVPLQKAPTSVYNTTLALALCVFLYVQFTGLTRLGPVKFVQHLMGDPKDAIGWAMVPLLFPLHVIGEFAKPLSLSLRLFGNILGEDVLLAVFAGLGVSILAGLHLPIGIPLHLPFIFLSILLGSIQALVFTVLATLYFSQVLPHEEHEEHVGNGSGEGERHAQVGARHGELVVAGH